MSSTSAEEERSQGPPPRTDGPKRTAFVSAPASADTTVLRELLARHGVDAFTADEVALPGRALSEVIRECVARADLVVAVLDGGAGSGNVLFELGFAQALGKRTLILVDADEFLPMVTSVGAPYL